MKEGMDRQLQSEGRVLSARGVCPSASRGRRLHPRPFFPFPALLEAAAGGHVGPMKRSGLIGCPSPPARRIPPDTSLDG